MTFYRFFLTEWTFRSSLDTLNWQKQMLSEEGRLIRVSSRRENDTLRAFEGSRPALPVGSTSGPIDPTSGLNTCHSLREIIKGASVRPADSALDSDP